MFMWLFDSALFIDFNGTIGNSCDHLCDFLRAFFNIDVFFSFFILFLKCNIFIQIFFFCWFEIKLAFIQISGMHRFLIFFLLLFISSLDSSLAVSSIVLRSFNFLDILRILSISLLTVQYRFISYLVNFELRFLNCLSSIL